MTTWYQQFYRGVVLRSVKYRWAVIPFAILACVAISYGASTLKFAGDYRVFFGPNNPDFLANENAQATFGKPDNIAFVVIPKSKNVYTEDTLSAVFKLTDQAWRLPYVSRVDSLTNFQNTVGEENDLIVEDLVVDPAELDASAIQAVRRIAAAEPLINGFVVARGGEATIVNAVVQLPSDIPNISTQVANEARAMRDAILSEHPNHDIYLTGVASLSAAFEEAGVRDASTLTPAVYGFILIVMMVALRSFAAVFASLLLILLSTLVGMGVGGFTGVELTPISLAAPTIILTIAVADAIHVIAGIRTNMAKGLPKMQAIIDATLLNFTPITITSVTTVIGFLTLNFSDSPPFHHLGNMSAAGIFAAWILSVTFLPALLSALPIKAKSKRAVTQAPIIDRIADQVIAAPKRIMAGTLITCFAIIAFIPTMSVNDQWSKYFGESLDIRQAIDAADPYFGSDAVEFVLDPGRPGDVVNPDFMGVVERFTAWLRTRENEVAHVFSVTDIMKRVNKNLNGDDPAFYAIPEDQTVASQFLLVYELSLPQGLDLNDRVDIDRQSTRVTATMKDISTSQTKDFVNEAETWLAANGGGYDFEITGSKVLFAFVAERNIAAAFEGALYLIIAIFVILAISFRSIKIGLVSLIPNALPLFTTFGVWALLVGVVGFSVAAVGAVAVGLVVDFTVHFLAKYFKARKGEGATVEASVRYAFQTAGVAIFLTTLILAAGFSVLVTSSFKLNADLGLLTAIAIVLAMLINFLFLPSLFLITGKRNTASPLTAAS